MTRFLGQFWREEAGMILSAELVLITTICVIGLVSGLTCLQQAVVTELQEVGMALTGLNQSYRVTGFRGCGKWWGRTSWTAGSGFTDYYDGCVGGSMGMADIGGGGLIIQSAPTVTPAQPEVIPGPCPPIIREPLKDAIPVRPMPCDLAPCTNCPPAAVPGPVEIPQGPAPVYSPQG